MLGGVARGQLPTRPNSATDPGQIVNTWYRHYLGRPAGAQAAQQWGQQLTTQPPPVVLSEILSSPEYLQRNGGTPQGLVLGLYRDVLGRTQQQLRSQDVAYWVNKMNQYGNPEQMIQEFLRDANTDIFNPTATPTMPAPPPNYASPQPQYSPPAYTPPAQQYAPPAPQYPPSVQQYAPPTQQYYTPPASTYRPYQPYYPPQPRNPYP
jgi:hypothetical protein